MQVDNPLQSQYSFNSAFEDFFNMEMLGGASNPRPGSSSTSPRAAFSALSPTPPHNIDSFFNFYLDDELAKPDNLAPLPATAFDFFGALTNPDFSSSSSQSGSGSSPEEITTPSVLAIDPQLVGTPSAPKSHSDIDEDEQHADPDVLDMPLSDDLTQILPYKVGGKGNSNRKGTVQGGGVVKKAGAIKEKLVSSPQSSVEDPKDSDDWRPSPEEYKKMSSKEKRQLRNKISARNFRVRRKEYITTLETDIAERDRLIDAIRGELGSTKSENSALRQEIDALKKALLQGQATPVLPPPAPLPAVSAAASVAARNTATPSPPLLQPNTNKDLPSSPRLAGARGGFWGGQGSSPFGAMGGFTPVHTTLVPEWSLSALAGKGLITPPESPPMDIRSPSLQENINPALNNSSQPQQSTGPNSQNKTPFDSFADMNPFTMKTLDMYRMHLWTRLAQQQNQQHTVQRQLQQTNSQPPLNGLATKLRPHYFTPADKQPLTPSNSSNSLSRILSGKGVAGSYPTPSSSPSPQIETPMRATAQEAALATLASQTLLSKLGSAFWQAFAGQSSASSSRKGLDADKIRKVLEGTAVVRVVDLEESASSPAMKPSSSTKVTPSGPKPSPSTSQKVPETKERCKGNCNVTDILEESMRSLSISKRGTF